MTIRARIYEAHQEELEAKNEKERMSKSVPEIVLKRFVHTTIRKTV